MDPPTLDEAAIFNAARRIEARQVRRLYLEQACGLDRRLLARLEALLRVHDDDPSFLQAPAEAIPTFHQDRVREAPGKRVGPYKLLEAIGEGGFGVVFMAEQDQPIRRKVALKVLKPGMDSRQVVARFEAERQALALMDHPHIAQVFDGGETDTGRPYFVMELVRGVPITEFCDRNRLPVQERLRLLVSVCHAVQHAHHKGVIHRDIKPSNVLVTLHDGVPVAKVIDFGIAKATAQSLTDKTLFTGYGQMIGTPAYMSPEQAEMSGLDVDTRSDVYSVGVLLYELLTGTTPIDATRLRSAGYAEVQRMIREEEAPPPSSRLSTLGERATVVAGHRGTEPRQLARLLAGDLDWVVLKALEKDRNRRYQSPGRLAEDVDRYLRREPVVARPASAAYRLVRFTQRHRGAVAAAAAVVLALVAGTAVAAWQAVAATRAKRDALAAAETARQKEAQTRAVLDFVKKHILAAAQPKRQGVGLGRGVTLQRAIEAALPVVAESFADQPLVEAQLRMTLGAAFQDLGEAPIAADQYERARALYTTHLGPDHAETLTSMDQLANCCDDRGQYATALKLRQDVLALRTAKLGPEHADTLLSMVALAASHQALGQHPEALKLRETAVPLLQAKLGPEHLQTLASMHNLANSYYFFGRYPEALKLYKEAVALRKRRLGPDDIDTLMSMNNLAATYAALGQGPEARDLYEETLALRKAKLGLTHPHTLLSMNNLANCYADLLGLHDKAYELRKQTLELRRAKLGPTHPETLMSMNNLANSLGALGQHAAALRLREEALAQEKVQLGIDHPETLWSMWDVAANLIKLNRSADALPIIDECLRLARGKVLDPDVLPGVVGLRLRHFEELKDVGGCRTTAELCERLQPTDAALLYKAAVCRAVTAQVIRVTDRSPDAASQADAQADRAMAWLTKAAAAGYKDLAGMKKDKGLDALRNREDFRSLLAGLEAGKDSDKK
jgi:non-specific serine/threonine protein kinase/serine/threonine-protein kinase